jgi:hypothetical protein
MHLPSSLSLASAAQIRSDTSRSGEFRAGAGLDPRSPLLRGVEMDLIGLRGVGLDQIRVSSAFSRIGSALP